MQQGIVHEAHSLGIVVLWYNAGILFEEAQVRTPFAAISKLGHFRSLPCSLSCIKEYLATGSSENVNSLRTVIAA